MLTFGDPQNVTKTASDALCFSAVVVLLAFQGYYAQCRVASVDIRHEVCNLMDSWLTGSQGRFYRKIVTFVQALIQ